MKMPHCWKSHVTAPLFIFQTSICGMKYDPTGQYVVTCATEDKEVKAWLPRRDGLIILYKLFHESPATVIQWCPLLGKGDDKKLMIAR